MNESQNQDLFLGHFVHETIRSHEQFSDGFVAELRNHLPAVGKLRK
jgi:hypothetical protein